MDRTDTAFSFALLSAGRDKYLVPRERDPGTDRPLWFPDRKYWHKWASEKVHERLLQDIIGAHTNLQRQVMLTCFFPDWIPTDSGPGPAQVGVPIPKFKGSGERAQLLYSVGRNPRGD